MHDPMTVAFDIKRPWPTRRATPFMGSNWDWPTVVTIWHVDPEKGGSDDSCGWFKRARHGDPATLKKIRGSLAFNWDADYGGWFDKDGSPLVSTPGIALGMFRVAARDHYGDWGKARRFLRKHLLDILEFADANPMDSMHAFVTQKYGPEPREERIDHAAGMIYGCILRWSQPWYRHARWHIWHWKIQVHPMQAFKRWAFSRCAGCGRRFSYGYSPVSHQWGGDGPRWFSAEQGVYHHECSGSSFKTS